MLNILLAALLLPCPVLEATAGPTECLDGRTLVHVTVSNEGDRTGRYVITTDTGRTFGRVRPGKAVMDGYYVDSPLSKVTVRTWVGGREALTLYLRVNINPENC